MKKKPVPTSPRRGFALVEFLVVLAIIGTLLSLLFPAMLQLRAAARRTTCQNNLKQIGLALHNYHGLYEMFPPGYVAGDVAAHDPADVETGPGYGWATQLLPQLDQQPLFKQIDFATSSLAARNQKLKESRLPSLICPTDKAAQPFRVRGGGAARPIITITAPASYVGVYGYGKLSLRPGLGNGMLFRNSEVRFHDVRDGTSHTLFIGERSFDYSPSTWFAAYPGAQLGDEGAPILVLGHVGDDAHRSSPSAGGYAANFWSAHGEGVNFLLCDGAVRYLHADVDTDVYVAMGTRNGHEMIGRFRNGSRR